MKTGFCIKDPLWISLKAMEIHGFGWFLFVLIDLDPRHCSGTGVAARAPPGSLASWSHVRPWGLPVLEFNTRNIMNTRKDPKFVENHGFSIILINQDGIFWVFFGGGGLGGASLN